MSPPACSSSEAAGFVLHFAPGSCSRVVLIALIEAGVDFDTALMRFGKGERKSPGYRRINLKGKVPVLVIGGEPLTENVVILPFLNATFPEAALLPPAATPLEAARQIADLCFCSATLHPLVTRIRMPGKIAGQDAAATVREHAHAAMREQIQFVEDRLADGDCWYGESWSVLDGYLAWVFGRVAEAGFPVGDYPRFVNHNGRMEARPSYQRALTIEAAASARWRPKGSSLRHRRGGHRVVRGALPQTSTQHFDGS